MNKDSFEHIYGKMYIDVSAIYKGQKQKVACNEDDYVIYDTVQKYKREFSERFQSASSLDPMKYSGREHAHCINLEQKRLAKLGLRKNCNSLRSLSFRKETPSHIIHETIGHYKMCRFTETIQKDIIYSYSDASTVARIERESLESYHVQSPTLIASGKYICPICGSEQPLKLLETGCSHCSHITSADNLSAKVIQHAEPPFILRTSPLVKHIRFWRLLWIVLFSLGFINIIFMFIGPFWPFLLVFIPLSIIAAFAYMKLCIYEYKYLKDRQKPNPYFNLSADISLEEFFATTGNIITALHYADTIEDVVHFVRCDISDFLKETCTIFDCELGKYHFISCSSDENYHNVSFQRSAYFYRYENNEAVEHAHIVEISLQQKVTTKFKSDYVVSHCPSCNKNYDWFSSPTCPNCGESPIYEDYDWVVTAIKILPFKDGKEMKKWF